MARYILMALCNATEGHDREFNDWYTNRHLPDVLKVPGFQAADRYEIVTQASVPASPLPRYLSLYEVEADDIAATHAALASVANSPAMPVSPTLDRSSALRAYFRHIAARRR